MKYFLRDNIVFDEETAFPATDGNVAVMFSGGMESMLAGQLAIEHYGKEKCIFMCTGVRGSKDPEKNYRITENTDYAASILGVDVEHHRFDDVSWNIDNAECLKTLFTHLHLDRGVKYAVYGFTKMLFDLEQISIIDPPNVKNIKQFIAQNSKHIKQIVEEFHVKRSDEYVTSILCQLRYGYAPPYVFNLLRMYGESKYKKILTPFAEMYKHHVIELYKNKNLLWLMKHTRSCTANVKKFAHCGRCFNCQQRHDAYTLHGIEDPTPYDYSDVVYRRKQLTSINNA